MKTFLKSIRHIGGIRMTAYNANDQPTLAWCLTKINPLKPGLRKAKDFEKKG
jgi:hypothetical protein